MKLLSSKGFSLVEITMAIGLLGLAGVAVMTLTESSNKETKWSEMNFNKSEFVSSFEKYITSSNGCEDLSATGAFSSTRDIVLSKWKVAGIEGNPNLPMEAGREFKFFKVTKLSSGIPVLGVGDVYVPPTSGKPGGIGNKGYLPVTLTLQAKANLKRSDSSAPNRNYSFNVRVPVIFDSSKKVLGCFENQSLRTACDAVGGDLDGDVCTPKGQCIFVKSFAIKDSSYNLPSPPGMDTCIKGGNNPLCTCDAQSVAYSTGANSETKPLSGPNGCKGSCGGFVTYSLIIYSCMICTPSNTSGNSFGGGSATVGATTSGSGGGGNWGWGMGSGSGVGTGP
jgi:hypothetical protein